MKHGNKNNVYIAEKNKKGHIVNARQLKNMTTEEFHEIAKTVYGEGSYQSRYKNSRTEEAKAIANVIKNQAKKYRRSMAKQASLKRGRQSAFYGNTSPLAEKYMEDLKYSNEGRQVNARAGVISVLSGEKSNVGDRTKFEGTRLIGSRHSTIKRRDIIGGKNIGGTTFYYNSRASQRRENNFKEHKGDYRF